MAVKLLIGCLVALLACGGSYEPDPIVGTWRDTLTAREFYALEGFTPDLLRFHYEFREDGSYTLTVTVVTSFADVSYVGTWAKTSEGYTMAFEGEQVGTAKFADDSLIITFEFPEGSIEISFRRDDKKLQGLSLQRRQADREGLFSANYSFLFRHSK